jgi:flavin reductase (DIM6/NTAB) family NADH-FMN oxidoreductase RutF
VPEAIADGIDYPLYVVTTSSGDELSGCLAGFVTQCSIAPIRYLICISKVNHTYGVAERSQGLALHLLGADQSDAASLFGELSGDCVAKFEKVSWTAGRTGAPILTDCAAWVEGPIINMMSAGDHEAFLISVSGGGTGSHQGQFMRHDAIDFDPGHPA